MRIYSGNYLPISRGVLGLAAGFMIQHSTMMEAGAQTWKWSTGVDWSSANSWIGGVPTKNGTADVFFSDNTNPGFVGYSYLDADWNVRSITWNSATQAGGKFSLEGSNVRLTVQEGFTDTSVVTVNIIPAIVLPKMQTWHVQSAMASSLNGYLATYGVISGAGGIRKTGSGRLLLDGSSNTYSGGTVVEGGTLEVSSGGSMGTGDVTLNGGILLNRGATQQRRLNVAQKIVLGTAGGTIEAMNADIQPLGGITGSGSLTLRAHSTGSSQSSHFLLTNTNDYLGNTQVNRALVDLIGSGERLGKGQVTLGFDSLLAIENAGNLAANQKVVMSEGSILLLKSPSLSPAAFVGKTGTTGGIIAFSAGSYSTPLDMATIGNGKLYLGASGDVRYTAPTLGAGSDGVYRLGGGTNYVSGSTTTSEPRLIITGTNVFAENSSVVIGVGRFSEVSNFILGGSVILEGANKYNGGTTLQNTLLGIGHDNALGTGALTIAANPNSSGIFAAGGDRRITNFIKFSGEQLAPLRITGQYQLELIGRVDLGGGTVGLNNVSAQTQTISGRISNGSLELGGDWKLTGTNSFAGGLTIYGSLTVTADSQMGASEGGVRLSGGTLKTTGSFTINRPITVTSNSTGGYIEPKAGTTLTITSPISTEPNKSLNKIGEGTLVLKDAAASSSFSLDVVEGKLQIDNRGATEHSRPLASIHAGATLDAAGTLTTLWALKDSNLEVAGREISELVLSGFLGLVSDAKLNFDIQGLQSDRIVVQGSGFHKHDSGTVVLNIWTSAPLEYGQSYSLIDWSSLDPREANIDLGDFALGAGSPLGELSIVDQKLIFTAVPEPQTIWLLIAAGVLAIRFKFRGSSARRRRA